MRFLTKKIFFLLILTLLPAPVLALDYSDCDSGTAQCSCLPDNPYTIDQLSATSVATCISVCSSLASTIASSGHSGSITSYSAQCQISGILTTLAQGNLGEETTSAEDAEETYDAPAMSVEIPGLTFTPAYKANDAITSNYLGEYIAAVYPWVLTAGSLLAIVMLMLGGLQYMLSRGKKEMISKATTRMRNAIVGIILLLGAFSIAQVVNPNFLKYESLHITYIDPQIYNDENKDLDFLFTIGADTQAYETSQGIIPGDILCDSSYSLSEVAESTVGRITYRYGGKGDPPIYESETKVDSNGVSYSTYCPTGTVCYDCSGYASLIRQCVGLSGVGGTSSIFDSSAIQVSDYSTEGYINGIQLIPGDMIGRPSWHVWTYIGDGQWAESHADRDPGEAIAITGWSYPFGIMFPKYNEAYLKVSH